MGTEEDAELLKEQRKKEDGRVEEDRKKGDKGWRYGAVSLYRYSYFAITEITEDELARDVVLYSTR
jgi:hypothetical protein